MEELLAGLTTLVEGFIEFCLAVIALVSAALGI